MGEKTGGRGHSGTVSWMYQKKRIGGQARWQELRRSTDENMTLPMIAICKEGNLVTDEMCVGDGSNPGSFAGSAGSKCIEAACEDLDAKLQAAINFVIIDWSIS